ncbi:MAG: lytic murein transglycosylase [Candidatus Moraniibacteriota bacterium]
MFFFLAVFSGQSSQGADLEYPEQPGYLLRSPFQKLRLESNQSHDLNAKYVRLSVIGQLEKNLLKESPNFQEVKRAVEFASRTTGVREDFLMGMLVVESDLGKNVGGCTYEEIEKDARSRYEQGYLSYRSWKTFLRREKVIKGLATDLNYDYRKLKVSCNPSRYAGTGGAMGIPQFMPDTWREYENRIAKALGKESPDPWELVDGVMAMAIKLSDVPGVVDHNLYAEKNAAKIYLSGNTSWRYNWYANKIQYWAKNYHQLM